jgi:hypothetical protein
MKKERRGERKELCNHCEGEGAGKGERGDR